MMKKRKVLVIAHRLSTIRKKNKNKVEEQGNIIQSDTYKELMKQDGLLKKLVELQRLSE